MGNILSVEIEKQKEYLIQLRGEKKRIEGFIQFCRRPVQAGILQNRLRAKQTEIERATRHLNELYMQNGGIETNS